MSDTRTGTTRRIPVSGECPLFFLSPTRADTAPTRPTPQQWRKRIYQGISAHFDSSGEFRCVLAVNLFRAGTRWMSFFFPEYFRYLHIFIFGVLDDHDSPNFSLQDHPSLLLPPFNRADSLGWLSFLFLFSFQRATPYFLYILERQSPILFLKGETSFYFLVKRGTYWDMHLDRAYFLSFFKASDGSCAFTVLHLTHRYLWYNLY